MTKDLKTGDGGTVAEPEQTTRLQFSRYQKFVVGLLAFLQFSIILDFMIISPLGAIIMPDLEIGSATIWGNRVGLRLQRWHLRHLGSRLR
jgi:hypothetical protein